MIATERLVLRRWRDDDLAAAFAMNGDPEVMRHFPATLDRAESDAAVARWNERIDREGMGPMAVERRDDGEVLGFCGCWRIAFPCPIEGEIEIGWRLRREAWGQGYARKAAMAALAHGFAVSNAAQITAMTVPGNTRSWGLMERLGMVRRAELDFDHPHIEAGSPLRRHIVYVLPRP